ncbi:ABC transporter ATP-binding protein [Autumnicola edwardsiae]|uniref:ABC transporter ATP-binding protein n=1 Tax=Autumnicola edwardsiae TaxID=3075594 RepID=A0ABU3CTQ0_9FLAO|nr:ABC transporter ATP-binding protein [Zunongwangia sp. F297]MDT0649661.1 ABC transporter ATP-binding protein [Zunongwangia sp. F297]
MVKRLIKKYFESLAYFYSYLGYRILIVVSFSIIIGILDGFGLTMFLPLLQMVSGEGNVDPDGLGNLSFLVDFFEDFGIELSLLVVLGIMTFFFLAKGIFQYFAGVYRVNVQEWFIKRLRLKNIKGLNNLAYKYFVNSNVGRIQNTLTGEVDRVATSYFNYFKAVEYGILVAVYMGFAFWIDAQFAILVTIGGALTNFLFKHLYKKTKGVSRTLTGENNNFQSLIIQNVGNYKYLKATGSLHGYGRKLHESVLRIRDSNVRIGKLDAILTAGREPILIIVVVSVIIIQNTLFGSELGPILLSLVFFYRALNYLMQLQVRWNKFLSVSGSLENMQQFEKELKENQDFNGGRELEGDIQTLELNSIYFYYGKTAVLKEINLNIKNNETVAFVGESGSGKTTLVNIIAGLLPVEEGRYKINKHISTELDLNYLQNKIGYITQDPVIFNDTLFNNITFWDEKNELSEERFWTAIKQAAIFDFINDLPDREETVLGNNGMTLSGGQRQRISIARELYKDVKILILDEATSALDSETEKAIQSNIDELKGRYTILIVAHRISTIKNADKIVVMKDGIISKTGNFNELVTTSSYFKKLVELQEL